MNNMELNLTKIEEKKDFLEIKLACLEAIQILLKHSDDKEILQNTKDIIVLYKDFVKKHNEK